MKVFEGEHLEIKFHQASKALANDGISVPDDCRDFVLHKRVALCPQKQLSQKIFQRPEQEEELERDRVSLPNFLKTFVEALRLFLNLTVLGIKLSEGDCQGLSLILIKIPLHD